MGPRDARKSSAVTEVMLHDEACHDRSICQNDIETVKQCALRSKNELEFFEMQQTKMQAQQSSRVAVDLSVAASGVA